MKFILTGHGPFAEGLSGAAKMVGGVNPILDVVPFLDDEASIFGERLRSRIREAGIASPDGAVVFCDLIGGTPFNQAMLEATSFDNIEVVAGTNLPMLLECLLTYSLGDSAQDVARKAVDAGRSGVVDGKVVVANKHDENLEMDGI